MRILITNDDGIDAAGLAVLEEIAHQIGDDIWTVAPASDQSGVARALTLSDPLRMRQVAAQRFAISGTPTDCVIMAVQHLMKGKPPDVILSGVNRGQNIAEDVLYSGTVAGAMEGAAFGVPAIALSQAYTYDTRNSLSYDIARHHGKVIIERLLGHKLDHGTLININFPACSVSDVAGVQVTRQGYRDQSLLDILAREDGRGFPYYWLAFQGRHHSPVPGTDLQAIDERYISITPLKLDITDYGACESLQPVVLMADDKG